MPTQGDLGELSGSVDCSKIVQPQICDATPGCEAVTGCCGWPVCQRQGEMQTQVCPRSCPASCQGQHDEASCNVETPIQGGRCHATFLDGGTRDCNKPYCELAFATCQPGFAACVPTTPRIGSCSTEPDCGGDFVAEYGADGCVIDCVRPSSCRSPD